MSSNAIVTDKLQLAYAQLINEAIGSPNLGKGATLHLTGLSDGPIPLAS